MRQQETSRAKGSRGRRLRRVGRAVLALLLGAFVTLATVRAAPTSGEEYDLPSFALPNTMAVVMSLAVFAIACMRYRRD